MRVAFYAPLKAPDRGAPSGDRRIARALMEALRRGGHEVCLASRFRAREARGDEARQHAIRDAGQARARRLANRLLARPPSERPAAWFTYHLYYKAPDWIGPLVADALGIPYVVAEASHAPKRDRPPWQMVHRAAAEAIGRADAVLALNTDDIACLRPVVAAPECIVPLPPFIEASDADGVVDRTEARNALAASLGLDPGQPWLTAVGMMRPGDKVASYRALAEALERVERTFSLIVVGDGEARAEVEARLAATGRAVAFTGERSPAGVRQVMAAADGLVWPAVNEAFGMAFIEAQAAGLPVVACRTRGVPDVVADGETGLLVPPDDPAAFARAVDLLLTDPAMRTRLAAAGPVRFRARHTLAAAADALDALLRRVVADHGARP